MLIAVSILSPVSTHSFTPALPRSAIVAGTSSWSLSSIAVTPTTSSSICFCRTYHTNGGCISSGYIMYLLRTLSPAYHSKRSGRYCSWIWRLTTHHTTQTKHTKYYCCKHFLYIIRNSLLNAHAPATSRSICYVTPKGEQLLVVYTLQHIPYHDIPYHTQYEVEVNHSVPQVFFCSSRSFHAPLYHYHHWRYKHQHLNIHKRHQPQH